MGAEIRQEIALDEFVIMPNHLHGIVMIGGSMRCNSSMDRGRRGSPAGPVSGSIGAIVGQFKSIVAKRINTMRKATGCPVWQRNYYEHIIRGERDLLMIREYIANNPLQWELDENNRQI